MEIFKHKCLKVSFVDEIKPETQSLVNVSFGGTIPGIELFSNLWANIWDPVTSCLHSLSQIINIAVIKTGFSLRIY